MTRATMRTTRASSNWLNGRNSTRAAFGRITIFVRRTIMRSVLSRRDLIYCAQQCLPFTRVRRLLRATGSRLERLDFDQSAQKRQGRLGAFVQVDSIDV